MGKYKIIIQPQADKDLSAHKKSGNKASLSKIKQILIELETQPFSGTGKPEKLKYDLIGYWSRRINQKDRIIYRVEENIVTVFVVSVMGHYDDK